MQANLQPSRASCTSRSKNCSEQTANQNTNIAGEVCKVAHKRTSGLTVDHVVILQGEFRG